MTLKQIQAYMSAYIKRRVYEVTLIIGGDTNNMNSSFNKDAQKSIKKIKDDLNPHELARYGIEVIQVKGNSNGDNSK